MRKLIFLLSFFVSAPLLLIVSVLFLSYTSFRNNASSLSFFTPSSKTVAYAAFPTSENIFQNSIQQQDARVDMIQQYLSRYESPLAAYAPLIVSTADTYHIDFRLITAIAQQESNLCKKAPPGSNNCWGFGIYGGKIKQFASYEEAIEIVTRTLAKNYINKGLTTPEEIMTRYTPSSNGSWAFGVSQFMDQLQ